MLAVLIPHLYYELAAALLRENISSDCSTRFSSFDLRRVNIHQLLSFLIRIELSVLAYIEIKSRHAV